MRRIRNLRGSLTVEASFILPVCIIAIVIIMYICFFIVDNGVATGILERELAKVEISGKATEIYLPEMKENLTGSLEKSLVAVSKVEVDCKIIDGKVRVDFKGRIQVPFGLILNMNCVVSEEIKPLKQVDFIRNVRRVADLIEN